MYLIGKVFHRRQAFGLGFIALEIIVQQFFKPAEYIFVYLSPCDELPFIETHAVVQQQFDVTGDEASAVLVGWNLQFPLYLVQAIPE